MRISIRILGVPGGLGLSSPTMGKTPLGFNVPVPARVPYVRAARMSPTYVMYLAIFLDDVSGGP